MLVVNVSSSTDECILAAWRRGLLVFNDYGIDPRHHKKWMKKIPRR